MCGLVCVCWCVLCVVQMTALSPDRPPPDRPKIRVFFPATAPIFVLFLSLWGSFRVFFFCLWGSSRGILVVFWSARTLNCARFRTGLSCETPAACRPLVAFTRQPVSGILHPETIIICSRTQGMFVTKRPETVSTKKRETRREEKRREKKQHVKRREATCALWKVNAA